MRVVVRVDASLAIGSGHVMRCLVLAEALKAHGADVRFVCRTHPGHLGATIAERGFAVDLLPVDPAWTAPIGRPYAAWLGTDQNTDAVETAAAIAAGGGADLLIVDHYGLDARFETPLRSRVGRILVVDDLADRPHDCDLLLDQNVLTSAEDRYAGLLAAGTVLLYGADFALLSPDFAAARRVRDGEIRRILVFFGGVDADNATLRALEGLTALARPDIAVDVVVGASNTHRVSLEVFAVGRSWVRLLPPQPSLAPLMAAADLAIGAGGVTALERAAAGLPSVIVAIAENQVGPARGLAACGGAVHLGSLAEVSAADVAAALRRLVSSPEAVRHIGTTAASLGDGGGLARVVGHLVTDGRRAAASAANG